MRLDDFTIAVSPTTYALTMTEASAIKDIAEELVEAYFEAYNWGDQTIYQYMGFTNIESVSFYDQSYSVIRIKGGLVSFDGSSSVIPSQLEIQSMIQEQLDPTDGGNGLTEALQATEDFSNVTETIYDVLWEPTPAPSVALPPTPSPVAATTTPEPSSGLVQVPVEGNPAPRATDSQSSGSSLLAVVAGIAGGLFLLATVAVLFIHQRRRRKAAWRKNANHVHPAQDDDLEQVITKNDAVMSEAGSSRLGRLLGATAAAVQSGGRFPASHGGDVTPPQSSSEESSGDFSEFDGEAVSVEPIILPIDTYDYVHENVDMDTSTDLESGVAALLSMQGVSQEANVDSEKDNVDGEEAVLFLNAREPNDNSFDGEGAVSVEPMIVPIVVEDYLDVEKTETEVDAKREAEATATSSLRRASLFVDTRASDDNFCAGEGAVSVEPFIIPFVAEDDLDVEKIETEVIDAERESENTATLSSNSASQEVKVDAKIDGNNVKQTSPLVETDNDNEESGEDVEKQVYAEHESDLMLLVDTNDHTNEEEEQDKGVEDIEMLFNMQQESDFMLLVDTNGNNDDEEDERVQDIEMLFNRERDAELPLRQGDDEPRNATQELICLPTTPAFATLECTPYNPWSDVSSHRSQEASLTDDDQQEFKPDESWDFNDNDDDSTDIVDDPFQTPSTLPTNDKKPLLRHLGTFSLEAPRASDENVDSEAATTTDTDSDAIVIDPFQTPINTQVDDEKPLLSRILGSYKLDKVETSDPEKRRRSRSAPPLVKNRTIDL